VEALADDHAGRRELFTALFAPGALRLTPARLARPGRKPLNVWRIEGMARCTFASDPTGFSGEVHHVDLPVSLVAARSA
jgi:hypothetical protein